MKKLFIFMLVLISLLSSNSIIAQELTAYGLRKLPQHLDLNPGAPVYGKWFISFPVLSCFQLSVFNNTWTYDDLLKVNPDKNDSLYFNRNAFESKRLNDKNLFNLRVEEEIINFGFSVKKNHLTFSSKLKIDGRLNFTKDIATLLKGNYDPTTGNVLNSNLSGLGPNTIVYVENSLGFSRELNTRMRIGLKFKYLMGLATLSTDRSQLTRTTQTDFTNNASIDYLVNVSAPLVYKYEGNDLTKNINGVEFQKNYSTILFKNNGFALDLGASYQLNEQWLFGASVSDLGLINWTQNASEITAKGSFTFNGLDLTPINGDINVENAMNKISKGIKDSIKIKATTIPSFSTRLPARFYLSTDYHLNDKFNFQALYRCVFYKENPLHSLTLSAQLELVEAISITASYTAMNNLYNNLGAGFCFSGKAFQLYIVTDNWNSLLNLTDANALNIRFGLNFVFGHEKIIDEALID